MDGPYLRKLTYWNMLLLLITTSKKAIKKIRSKVYISTRNTRRPSGKGVSTHAAARIDRAKIKGSTLSIGYVILFKDRN